MSDTANAKGIKIATILHGTDVFAASLDYSRELLTTEDAFLQNQCQFDRQARMRLPDDVQRVTVDDYLTFVRTQTRGWTPQEVQGLANIFSSIRRKFMFVDLELPKQIYLVKTSGQEEGFSAYTRHDNTIVMSETKVALMGAGAGGDALHPQGNAAALEDIYVHEFFHLFSKNNPDMRHKLYAEVGYSQSASPVELPKTAMWKDGPMSQMKITNPDTPSLNVAIDLVLPDDPSGEPVPMMPVLLVTGPYESGIFFQYLDWVFMRVDTSGDHWTLPVDSSGMPQVVAASSPGIMRQYMAKVGYNISEEIFHPDEILAQNFVLVINEPSLGILRGISDAISAAPA
ncbi:hypothetical protein [Falsiphaeobacter marinintestinus]|uniref:hypothetical protein n=1 Tax=Falsiphaeobacter marinintestinus TaxID=1492905 RepID=UPI0011B47BE1|nr:hypothetical protein [Phaeobacter marinintestinus]